MNSSRNLVALAAAAIVLAASPVTQAQQSGMTFFVTSVGPGKGADFGGVLGADQYCQKLAATVGAGNQPWRAYLSVSPLMPGAGVVHAKDRVGKGPWTNAKGVVVATNVAQLHGENNLTKQTALTEKGEVVNGRGDTPNNHDVLTGSKPDGTAIVSNEDTTCGNWTKSTDGSATVGHIDRIGLRDDAPSKSWNSSHKTNGCSVDALRSTGGAGLIYCFVANN